MPQGIAMFVTSSSQVLPRHVRNNVLRRVLGRRKLGKADRVTIMAETKKKLEGNGACVVSTIFRTITHPYIVACITASLP